MVFPTVAQPALNSSEKAGLAYWMDRVLEKHWKLMRKAGRRLFRQLGTLRDTHVLAEWVRKLGAPDEASTAALLEELQTKYDQDRAAAQDAANAFDRKQWRTWLRELGSHFRHV